MMRLEGLVVMQYALLPQLLFTLECRRLLRALFHTRSTNRGQRRHAPLKSSSGSLADSTSCNSDNSARPPPIRRERPIPWSAKAIGRMRLESDGLFRVMADSLVGARARTPHGKGRVIAVRDVSIRCEVETLTTVNKAKNKAKTVTASEKAGETTYKTPGDETDVDTAERHVLPMNETQVYFQPRTTKNDISTPGVMKGGLASRRVRGLLYEDRNVCGSNEGGTEATSRAKRRGEGHEDDRHGQKEQWGDHATAASGGPERCLHERVPDEESGALRCIAGYHSWENGGNDDDARNDCSVGTERAAEFDDYAEIVINERTHGDYGLGQVGAGSWSAHGGASFQGT